MNSRRTSKTRKRTPNNKNTNSKAPTSSSRSKPKDKEEAGAGEQPGGQREETAQDQGEVLILGEKWWSEDTEGRRGQSQDNHFLDAFKRSLDRKRQDLAERAEDLKQARYNKWLRELVLQDQDDVKVLEDSIQSIQEGTCNWR